MIRHRESTENDTKVLLNNEGWDKIMSTDMHTKKKRFTWKTIIVVLCFLILAGVAVFFWHDAQQAHEQSAAGIASRNQSETDTVLDTLGKLILIDTKDKPTVAKVEDPNVLKKSNADFYKNVQEGDYLILYPQRAIILRMSNKQIINIAPIISKDQVDTKGTNSTDGQ